MPAELKELIAQTQVNDFGPGGILEEDDTELWSECERGVAGRQARGHHLNYQMGAGHTITNQEGVPDWMGPLPESIFKAMPGSHFGRTLSDLSAREFYSHWAKRISQNGGNGR